MSTNPEEIIITHCQYFVVRKKRFCRMTVKSGYKYCGEHEPKLDISDTSDSTNDARLRVTCPLDNKHTCFASKLAKHLKKCNAQNNLTETYLVKDINTVKDDEQKEDYKRELSNVPTSKIMEIISKVNTLYEDIIANLVTTKILNHEILTDEIKNPEYGDTTRKHLVQTSSIIQHLNSANLINPNTCFVEFGAGKGQLSFWLSKVIQPVEDSSILIVERASLRHKMDNKLDKTKNNIHRIRADIADLVLNEVEIVKGSKNVVGVTKHLCGDATDLALRCLINGINKGVNVQGLVMAFCCHHRCHWPIYTGKQFFQNHNLTREDFDIICGLVSWATCGSGLSREARENMENQKENQEIEYKVRENEINLSREEKELVGRKCKLLIDYGRTFYLESNDFLCNLHYYVDQHITLENVCVVAQNKTK